MDKNLASNVQSTNPTIIQKVNPSIYCFICGIAYKATRFMTHYTECKSSFQQMPLGKKRPVKENELFVKIISKLQTGEDISEDLQEYHEIAEELYFNLLAKECPNCHCEFLPEKYLTHADSCLKQGHHKVLVEYNEYQSLDLNSRKNETKMKIKRKSSMDNLKTITKDEVKEFKLFNIRHPRYKDAF